MGYIRVSWPDTATAADPFACKGGASNRDAPVDGGLARSLEQLVGLGKVAAAEKAVES